MNIKVSPANAQEHLSHHWTTEASCLRLTPNDWPRSLETELGNGEPFLLVGIFSGHARYWQNHGCIELTVFND